MTKRASKKVITGVTEEQFQDAMAAYATADAQMDKLIAVFNLKQTELRQKHEGPILEQQALRDDHIKIVEAYCLENKQVLFAKKRSMDTAHGIVGFRLGTPKLKTLPKYTWEKVLEKLGTVLPAYIRTKKEVDKEQLLADRTDEKVAPHLADCGVYVDQDESFFVELKKEEAAA